MALTCAESRMMCSSDRCKHFAFDMDSSYCTHPKSFELSPIFGLSVNAMSIGGHCTGAFDDPEKNKRQLFEARLPKTSK